MNRTEMEAFKDRTWIELINRVDMGEITLMQAHAKFEDYFDMEFTDGL